MHSLFWSFNGVLKNEVTTSLYGNWGEPLPVPSFQSGQVSPLQLPSEPTVAVFGRLGRDLIDESEIFSPLDLKPHQV